MKKTVLMLATAGALVAGMASCKKEKMPKEAITQTVTVSLAANEKYTFTLPKNLRDDAYEITDQAEHYSLSEVGVNTAGERVFNYTPAAGYVGNDQVVLSNDEEREAHKPHPKGPKFGLPLPGRSHKGQCKGGEEDHYIITINFVVKDTNNLVK